MPELGPLGSVRGAVSNGRPYRERVLILIAARHAVSVSAGLRLPSGSFQC